MADGTVVYDVKYNTDKAQSSMKGLNSQGMNLGKTLGTLAVAGGVATLAKAIWNAGTQFETSLANPAPMISLVSFDDYNLD